MLKVLCLEDHGLPLYTTSYQGQAQKLETVLTELESQGMELITISTVSLGRNTYHLGAFRVTTEAPVPKSVKTKVKANPE